MKKSVYILLITWAFSGCLTINKNFEERDLVLKGSRTVTEDPERDFEVRTEMAEEGEKAEFEVWDVTTIQKEKVKTYEYRVVEVSRWGMDQKKGNDDHFCGFFVLPLTLPVYMMMSGEKDLGKRKREAKEDISPKPREERVMKGSLILYTKKGSVSMPLKRGKAEMDLAPLKQEGDCFKMEFRDERGELQREFEMSLIFGEGKERGEHLEGETEHIKMTIHDGLTRGKSLLNAKLTNKTKKDIILNGVLDEIFFIMRGKSIKGELIFYYNPYTSGSGYEGNYPNRLPAGTFVEFMILTQDEVVEFIYEPVFIKTFKNMKKAVYRIGSEDMELELKPSREKRMITEVSVD